MKVINWGIIGCGRIAAHFANDLALVKGSKLYAVASRSEAKAKAFATELGADQFYGSYEAICQDPLVDIIYVATPHSSHLQHGLLVLNHGKHLLCEKPLAVNESQVQQLIATAQVKEVFLMEALWSRFNPSIQAVLKHVQDGLIGEVNYINADFCFQRDFDAESRLFNPDLAGGALLDIGIYPLFLSYLLLGYPNEVVARSQLHANGVDLQSSAILCYDQAQTIMNSGLVSRSDMTARINGTKGSIHLQERWHEAQSYSTIFDGVETIYELPTLGRGYSYEIAECADCIRNGKKQSDKWSHSDSLNLVRILDSIRKEVGIKYPFE